MQPSAQPAVAEQGIDHPGEAAEARAAREEFGYVGQCSPDDEQDEQLAAAEALLDLAPQIPPPQQVEHQVQHREVDEGRGDVTPGLPVGELGQGGVEGELVEDGQADGIQGIDGQAGDDDHQGQGARLMEKVGNRIRHPLAVVDAGVGPARLPGGFHVAGMIGLGQEALHLLLGLGEAPLVRQPDRDAELGLGQLARDAQGGEVIHQRLGHAGVAQHQQLDHAGRGGVSCLRHASPAWIGNSLRQASKPPSRL